MTNLTLQEVKDIIINILGKDIENNVIENTNKIYDDYEYNYVISDNMIITIFYKHWNKDEVSYIKLIHNGLCLLTIYRQYREVVESICELAKKLIKGANE